MSPKFELVKALGVAAASGLLFVLVVELAICGIALFEPHSLTRLAPGDTIALLTGAVTAAALSAIYLQLREARKEEEARDELRNRELAYKADQLHAEFNSPEMRRHRDIAYPYIGFLNENGQTSRLTELAKSWILDDHPGPVPEIPFDELGKLKYGDYSMSFGCMLAFFVRVSAHLRLNEKYLDFEDITEITESFYWSHWKRKGLVKFVEEIKRYHKDVGYDIPRPYFIDGIERLVSLSTPSKPGAQQNAADQLPARGESKAS